MVKGVVGGLSSKVRKIPSQVINPANSDTLFRNSFLGRISWKGLSRYYSNVIKGRSLVTLLKFLQSDLFSNSSHTGLLMKSFWNKKSLFQKFFQNERHCKFVKQNPPHQKSELMNSQSSVNVNTSSRQGSLFYTETELNTPWVIIKKPWKNRRRRRQKFFRAFNSC